MFYELESTFFFLAILIPLPQHHEYLEQGNIRVTLSYVGCVNSPNDTFTYVYVIHFDGDILTPFFGSHLGFFFVASRELQKSLEKRQDTCHLSELRETYGLMFDTASIPQNLILNIPIFVIFQQEVPFVFIELKS